METYKIYDFPDESAWLKGRMNGIGGSDASAIVGLNPYKSNIDLFEEKIGRRIPEDISNKPCVIYGKLAEALIRELFKLDYPEYQVEHYEFRILQVLFERAGKIVSRDEIIARLWDSDEFIDDNTLTVNVARLRKKLESAGMKDVIRTKKGIGYIVE